MDVSGKTCKVLRDTGATYDVVHSSFVNENDFTGDMCLRQALEGGSWAEDPALWFVQVENKFRLHRITSQIRQYELLINALPPQATTEVRDILLSPLGDTPYHTVKEALLSRLVASEQRRLQQLLSAEELELAELANRIMEVNSPTIGATQRTSDLTSDIAELRKAMEKLTAEVSELRRESSQRARPCRPTLWSPRELSSTLTISPVFYKVAVPIPPTVWL
ncbi:hypothetical protein HPB47_017786 [Ixodes persulcatus]|uniref:Uncharacterized protein n=1 Tax=Ixodes persulcatus TaxID=34615 RepID=A0AC60QN92_IXOPE|nr:hypothetical protein HPB47_017786 [Ixodes persulcatus]